MHLYLYLRYISKVSSPTLPLCGFSLMEQVRLCAVWTMDSWLGSSRNNTQGLMTVRECYRHALEKGCLPAAAAVGLLVVRLPASERGHLPLCAPHQYLP